MVEIKVKISQKNSNRLLHSRAMSPTFQNILEEFAFETRTRDETAIKQKKHKIITKYSNYGSKESNANLTYYCNTTTVDLNCAKVTFHGMFKSCAIKRSWNCFEITNAVPSKIVMSKASQDSERMRASPFSPLSNLLKARL